MISKEFLPEVLCRTAFPVRVGCTAAALERECFEILGVTQWIQRLGSKEVLELMELI